MDLNYGAAVEDFRKRVVNFLATQLPPEWGGAGSLSGEERTKFLENWRERLVEQRLLGAAWPERFGGAGLSVMEESVLTEEFTRAGVPVQPHPNDAFGFNLLGPTLLRWGTETQLERFLPGTLSGDILWAQGYSEPESGSDLFNLRTRGDVVGDQLVINGQKIWQTAGLTANWLFTVIRTDQQAQRSKGLSFVLVPLEQPGVEVRGIRDLTGSIEFSEVFFTDAVTSMDNVVGGLGNGAKVALTLLGFERGAGGVAAAVGLGIELDRIVKLAISQGRADDRSVRERIGDCWTRVYALRSVALQVLSTVAAGAEVGPLSSIVKTMTAEYHQHVTELALDILGMNALTPDGAPAVEWLRPQPLGFDASSSAAWVSDYLAARAGTIYGGASEIQRNTIAEQILRMPREPRVRIEAVG